VIANASAVRISNVAFKTKMLLLAKLRCSRKDNFIHCLGDLSCLVRWEHESIVVFHIPWKQQNPQPHAVVDLHGGGEGI